MDPTVLIIIFMALTMVFGVLFFMLLILARGPGLAFIKARLKGAPVLTVVRRDRTAVFGVPKVTADIAETKNSGQYVLNPEGMYSAGGVLWGVAPSTLGAVVKPEFGQVASELKKRGITNITEAYDAKTKKLKEEAAAPVEIKPQTCDLTELYKFIQYNVHPNLIDAKEKLMVAKELARLSGGKNYQWMIYLGVMVLLIFVGLMILLSRLPSATTVIQQGGENIISAVAVPALILRKRDKNVRAESDRGNSG